MQAVWLYIENNVDRLASRGHKKFSKLTQKSFVIGTDIDYFYAPGAHHNEAAWAERLDRPLYFLFGKDNNISN